MSADEGAKVSIHEWHTYNFYINRVDHGPPHVHVYEHNRIICEYDLKTLERRQGRAKNCITIFKGGELETWKQTWQNGEQ